ncbi:MAG TPA: hypothetical protein VH459_09875 [Gaiellales bacterium]
MLHLPAATPAILGGGLHQSGRLHVAEPRADEVWDGRIQGRAAGIVDVRAGGRRYTLVPGPDARFSVRLPHVVRRDTGA